MRKGGKVKAILPIERMIIETGCYTVPQDSSVGFKQLFGANRDEKHVRAFNRIYEVYLELRSAELVKKNDVLELFDIDQVFIRFWFDYRTDIAEVKIRDKDLAKFYYFLPKFKVAIEKLEDLDLYRDRVERESLCPAANKTLP